MKKREREREGEGDGAGQDGTVGRPQNANRKSVQARGSEN